MYHCMIPPGSHIEGPLRLYLAAIFVLISLRSIVQSASDCSVFNTLLPSSHLHGTSVISELSLKSYSSYTFTFGNFFPSFNETYWWFKILCPIQNTNFAPGKRSVSGGGGEGGGDYNKEEWSETPVYVVKHTSEGETISCFPILFLALRVMTHTILPTSSQRRRFALWWKAMHINRAALLRKW